MPTLTWGDLEAIRKAPSVRYASPALRTGAQLVAEEQNWGTSVFGVSPEYFEIRNWRVERGALFGEPDVDAGAKVVILGQTVVEKLYGPGANAVGQSIRIHNVPFEVIGVLIRKGQSPLGQDYDDVAYVPYSTFRAKIQGGLQNFVAGPIFVSAIASASTTRALDEITAILRERHHIEPGVEDDFSIRNLAEFAAMQQQGTKIMTSLLAAVAVVSLAVGGIGIMNIMLVSVTERTREIGIRMAVGAKPHQILGQFLVESMTLSMMGGVLGVLIGAGIAYLLSVKLGWPLVIDSATVAISFSFSLIVGIGFGIYPAQKASRLDPIEALRFE
jgi:putative ABC transport system permease protein